MIYRGEIICALGHDSKDNNRSESKMSVHESIVSKTNIDEKMELQGLTSKEAKERFIKEGPNEIEEVKESLWKKLFGYFWGPIPWMIELAAVLSLAIQHYDDFALILTLLLFNAGVAFWQEFQAGNAIDALKNKLALKARVLRDGIWSERPARELVPGDIIRLRLGDIIPADAILKEGEYLTIDQSVLTGESLPVTKKPGEEVYSGSIVEKGEMVAEVKATGKNTYFGKTAKLVGQAKSVSHFQKAVLQIGNFLIYLCLVLVSLLILIQLVRGDSFFELLKFSLILTVASIPVAMPAVLSVTMAVGALALSKMKAIVTKLESIEEMAGVDILCSDKTGTLTYNRLTIGTPRIFGKVTEEELMESAALASRAEDLDPIDQAVLGGVKDLNDLKQYHQTKFTPFDPVIKRTEAVVQGRDSQSFQVTKGAPQVILELSSGGESLKKEVKAAVEEFAKKGFRTLGVARNSGHGWQFLGLIPLYDEIRKDSKVTLAQAREHGIRVKMVTGDNLAIAKEVSSELKIGDRIFSAQELLKEDQTGQHEQAIKRIEEADGFAEVFPENKFWVVQVLQAKDHIVGMTGDGVNDAPALKQANLGIAVSGATDAARAAATLVLTASGLSVIISAVEEARRIFERMTTYATYRVTETIRIMFFMVLAMIAYNMYPVTALMLILLALLNDIPIMTIAYDRTALSPTPVRWQMSRVITLSSILGGIGLIETFLLLVIADSYFGIEHSVLQSMLFLKLSIAGHLTLFIVRQQGPFWSKPYPAPILLTTILATQVVAALLVGFGVLMTAVPWSYIGVIWLYCIFWMFIEDAAKLSVYRYLEKNKS